jgi:2,3-bisphosphoglycerate-independent phosphoglycerate mutase
MAGKVTSNRTTRGAEMKKHIFEDLVVEEKTKIIFLIMDGLGGVQTAEKGGTELQVAQKPHLDQLARESICGLLDPISPGISPGSGPAHFALFGYDPVAFSIGRGILEAAGIDFPLTGNDVVSRINFCTVNKDGVITDRRAGRIDTNDNVRICEKLEKNIRKNPRLEDLLVKPVKEHRAVVIFRGTDLYGDLEDTDPQKTGLAPLPPKALNKESEEMSRIAADFITQVSTILSDEPKANMLLLRGFAKNRRYPSLYDRYKITSVAIAAYPMYKGIARLLGMEVLENITTIEEEFKALKAQYNQYDFFFVHIKPTDSRGEDGDFDAKVKVIEEVDRYIPQVRSLNPDVLVVTGDHSTPALLKSHSWHPVPVLLNSSCCRYDRVSRFDEIECIQGGLGRMASVHLMWIALSNANRLAKFGA